MIDDLGGLLSEVCKFCGDDIFCVTDPRVPEEDLAKGQNIFVYLHWVLQKKVNGWRNSLKIIISCF